MEIKERYRKDTGSNHLRLLHLLAALFSSRSPVRYSSRYVPIRYVPHTGTRTRTSITARIYVPSACPYTSHAIISAVQQAEHHASAEWRVKQAQSSSASLGTLLLKEANPVEKIDNADARR